MGFARFFTLAVVLALGVGSGFALSSPEQTVTVYVHGYSGPGVGHTGTVGLDSSTGDMARLTDLLGLPSYWDEPGATDQLAACEYLGDRVPHPDSSYYDLDDYDEVRALMPPNSEGGVPLYALVCAKFLRHVVERSGAEGANLLGASFGGAVTRYMVANDVDGICSDGLVSRWCTLEGAVNGVWIAQNPLAQPILRFLDEDSVEIKHMTYHWVRRNVDPGQPTPNHRWSPPNWGTSPGYRHTLVHHFASTDWALFGGLLRKLGHLPNDGEITVGDAALAHILPEVAWAGQQPLMSYNYAMHLSEERLEPDHIGLQDHDGMWAGLATTLSGSRRVTVRLVEATAHKSYELPLQGKGEFVFGAEVYSPWSAVHWGTERALTERRLGHGTAPMARFARGETRALDLVIFDQLVVDDELELELDFSIHELDWSDFRNYLVFENALQPSRRVAEDWLSLDLENPGRVRFASSGMDVILETTVLQLDMDDPRILGPWARWLDEETLEVGWSTDEPARASLAAYDGRGRRRILQGSAALRTHHAMVVDGRGIRRFVVRAEDAAANLARGPLTGVPEPGSELNR